MGSRWFLQLCLAIGLAAPAFAGERTERFDKDPGWDAQNNRAVEPTPRTVRQDFGYSPKTAHAGGKAGEVGGHITPSAEPAYYGKRLDAKTLRDPLTASGRLNCTGQQFHVLLGFFNAGTLNEWRTPSTISIRLQGRGDVLFAYVEYMTSRWRAGGDTPGGFATVRDRQTGREQLRGFPLNKPLNWSLRYNPNGDNGNGSIAVTLGDEKAICHLSAGHKADGATFTHFGLIPVMKSADTGGELWLDDVEVNGTTNDFARDPGWEGLGNRRTFESANVRPRFDFGYSATRHAGGLKAGELGGIIFRGDCRYPSKLAAYGDRLATLNLDKPLKASGKVALRRAVSDSTSLIGFYHSKESLRVNPSQKSGIPPNFLGVAVEGPSSEGFFFYPMYRVNGDGQGYADGPRRPRIMPDGKSHNWSLEFDPTGAEGRGRIVVKLDQESAALDLAPEHRRKGAQFDRFGIVTTWIDGNGQHLYFDDLTYTTGQ